MCSIYGIPVYIVHRYRFAQGTVVPGIMQAYSHACIGYNITDSLLITQ